MNDMTDKIEAVTEAELVKRNSAAMKRLERIWDEVSRRMDEKAGEMTDCDGRSPYHYGIADAEEIRAALTILHRQMDRFAATYGDVPIARSGER